MTLLKNRLTSYQQTPDDYNGEDIADNVRGTWEFILAVIVSIIGLLGIVYLCGYGIYLIFKH